MAIQLGKLDQEGITFFDNSNLCQVMKSKLFLPSCTHTISSHLPVQIYTCTLSLVLCWNIKSCTCVFTISYPILLEYALLFVNQKPLVNEIESPDCWNVSANQNRTRKSSIAHFSILTRGSQQGRTHVSSVNRRTQDSPCLLPKNRNSNVHPLFLTTQQTYTHNN